MPIFIDILRVRVSGNDQMSILVVTIVTSLKLTLDGGSRTSMLAFISETLPQLQSSQTHLYYWLIITK